MIFVDDLLIMQYVELGRTSCMTMNKSNVNSLASVVAATAANTSRTMTSLFMTLK